MTNLIRQFGTHYMKKAEFGAELVFEKRYTSSSNSSQEASRRGKCSEWEAEGCIDGGMSIFGFIPIGPSVQACSGTSGEKCEESGFDNAWGSANNVASLKIHTIGSAPKKFDEWGDEDDFKPVPIRYV